MSVYEVWDWESKLPAPNIIFRPGKLKNWKVVARISCTLNFADITIPMAVLCTLGVMNIFKRLVASATLFDLFVFSIETYSFLT